MILVGLLLGLLFVTPFVVTYVVFIRWCDRFEPEPWWLIICAFVWGALFATIGGGISSGIIQSIVEATTGAVAHDPDIEAFGATVLAPVFEEGFKGLGVAIIAAASAMGLKELDGALDGAIYGGVIGLGFTLTEDILYVSAQFEQEGLGGFVVLLFLRTVLLGLSHCTFTACTGLGFGIAAETRSSLVKVLAPIGMRNWAVLVSRGWRAFAARRRKQLALVELAFIKNRRRRGEHGRDLDMKEAKLRQEIWWANRQGIWIGS
jgi:RsiW-degrading membrane proteinase PrsW (M82 family)